jgi:transcriptional regulator with GAF, ATPase, and Fis domain
VSGGRPTQIVTSPGNEVRRKRKLAIRVSDSPDEAQRGKSFTFAQDEVRIGSSPELDVSFDDRKMSREHLSIRPSDQGYLLIDRHSTNGTFVGGLRIERVIIDAATTVRLGRTLLEIEPLGEHVESEMSSAEAFGRLIGQSPAMREMFALLERIAPSDLTVLIEGETGTGKELVAEGLHDASGRDGPCVTLNCGAIPRELIESELMGHVKGAFTGAVADRPGAFVSANGGTLFLDEVGELPLDMQAKLLRVLERREVKAVGSDSVTTVDVRVVAATNKNLAHEAEHGTFRQDLYYRLAVVVVRIPPLRARLDDLPLLVTHIQGELNRRRAASGQAPYPPLDARAFEMLARHEFPGNVRELRNIVERWSVLGAVAAPGNPAVSTSPISSATPVSAGGGAIEGSLLELPYHEAKEAWLDRFEKAYVVRALDRAGGNVSQAARDARVDRRHLQRLMSRYEIKKE